MSPTNGEVSATASLQQSPNSRVGCERGKRQKRSGKFSKLALLNHLKLFCTHNLQVPPSSVADRRCIAAQSRRRAHLILFSCARISSSVGRTGWLGAFSTVLSVYGCELRLPAAENDDTLVFPSSRSSLSPTLTAGRDSAASRVDSLCDGGPGGHELTWLTRSGDCSRRAMKQDFAHELLAV